MRVLDEGLSETAYDEEEANDEYWYVSSDGRYLYKIDAGELMFEGDESMYFIDSYSMVSPTEDRARIMEFAMSGYSWYFTDYEPTMAKLEYYCECIRDCFDTSGWSLHAQI